MSVLMKIFTWWDGATIGTLLWSKRNGGEVGHDGPQAPLGDLQRRQ
jgi:hypothetical protein